MLHQNGSPNILLITADQLRFDYVGAYQTQNAFMQTPNIDSLAKGGCICRNAYSPNPVCIPARQGLLTGLTAKHHGFDDNYFGNTAKSIPWYLPTFGQILSDAGYKTAAIGKMHFQPERRSTGFDIFLNADEVVRDITEDEYAMELRALGYSNVASYHGVRNVLYMQPQQSTLPESLHSSHWIADKSINFLRNHRTNSAPFLLWAGFIHPHPPFDIPPAWAHRYDGKIPPHTSSITPLSLLAEENKCIADLPDEENINRIRELYACAVSYVDNNVGRIVQALKENGYYENTLIIFTSDHGEMLGDLDTYQKFLPYDASCRIPLILHWPERIAAGTEQNGFADLNDILPTMLEAAGVAYPAGYALPGASLLSPETGKDRRYQYAEHQRESKRWCMLRDQRYKFVHYYGDAEQLFDMQSDPEERINLLQNKVDVETGRIRDRLRKLLIVYEEKYGLDGCIAGGDFCTKPPYVIQTYRECVFPHMTIRYPGDAEKLDCLEDEILRAIRNEPTVRLSRLHMEPLLRTEGGFSKERFEAFIETARRAGRY